MKIYKCKFCEKECLSSRSYINHELRCKLNVNRDKSLLGNGRPVIRPPKFVGPPAPKHCEFCNKFYPHGSSTPALNNHVRRCPSNPNKIREILTPEGKQKIIQGSLKGNLRWKDEEERKKQSIRMRKVAFDNPSSYSQRNVQRSKKITYQGINFDSTWEFEFFKWCENNNIKCERNTKGFKYNFEGVRTYYPDFYLPDFNTYVEIKGQETEKDYAKWRDFPKNLIKIKKKEIDLIKENTYTICMET